MAFSSWIKNNFRLIACLTFLYSIPLFLFINFRYTHLKVVRIVDNVDGFELRHTGMAHKIQPFLGVGYVIWSNYSFFTYNGDTYERAGVDGVVIRKNTIRPTKYLVEEISKNIDLEERELVKSSIRIFDKSKSEIIASRIIRKGQVENQTGWEGQHAVEFVRSVLHVGSPIKNYQYPTIDSDVNVQKLDPNSKRVVLENKRCPDDFEIIREPGSASLNTEKWRFLPKDPIDSFACWDGHILVHSRVYPDNLHFDLLDFDGNFIGQFRTYVSSPVQAKVGDIENFSLKNGIIQFHIEHQARESMFVAKYTPYSYTYFKLSVADIKK